MAGPSGATPILALPYPIPDDSVDVPRDVLALATKLDSLPGITPPALVSVLPGSPADGQEVYYAADPANGVMWHLRYRAASSSAYKWECVGGSQMKAGPSGNVVTNSASFIALAGGPTLTVPLAGEYDIDWLCSINTQGVSTVNGYCDLGVNGVRSSGGTPAFATMTTQFNGGDMPGHERRVLPVAAVLTMMVMSGGVTNGIAFSYAVLRVRPVRLG